MARRSSSLDLSRRGPNSSKKQMKGPIEKPQTKDWKVVKLWPGTKIQTILSSFFLSVLRLRRRPLTGAGAQPPSSAQ